jgi:hypothetical protein
LNYDKEIINILGEANDKGISAMKIACHIYNDYNSFFDLVDFDTIYHYVSQFLMRNSKNPDSIIEKADSRGRYCLNLNSNETQQLMFEFENGTGDNNSEEEQKPSQDLSLLLFDE